MNDLAEHNRPGTIEAASEDGTVVLRSLTPDDAEAYFGLINQGRKHLDLYEGIGKTYETLERVRDSFIHPKPDRWRFGIYVNGEMVGSNNLTRHNANQLETGSWIGAGFLGNHYASRAREPLLRIAFTMLSADEVVSEINPLNTASRRSVEASGYTKVYEDSVVCKYVITRDEWEALQRKANDEHPPTDNTEDLTQA